MDAERNTRIVLTARPDGDPAPCHFAFEQAPVPTPGEGEVLLRTRLLSMDACARVRACDTSLIGERMRVGEVMRCSAVAEVVRSRHPAFKPGDRVLSHSGWQDFDVVHGSQLKRKLHERVAPCSTALGVYGVYGFVAWAAMTEAAPPQAGQTVAIGSAAGPTGATAGQLARLRGARVVGVTSSAEKCDWLRDELGFDAALDFNAPDFDDALRAACPDGIDVFVPGLDYRVLDAALPLLNTGARLPVWGMSMYHPPACNDGDRLPRLLAAIVAKRLQVRGFTARDIVQLPAEHIVDPAFMGEMGAHLRHGRVRYREQYVDGLEAAPQALQRLLDGDNFGKLIVRVG
ncbi:MAG: NADP-dependent oxidoreductase [Pseudoxanthomonas sp.]